MTRTIKAYAVLREDGTVKEHQDNGSFAIFPTEEIALNVSGKVVPCTITYEA
jgi:hypothetical protein